VPSPADGARTAPVAAASGAVQLSALTAAHIALTSAQPGAAAARRYWPRAPLAFEDLADLREQIRTTPGWRYRESYGLRRRTGWTFRAIAIAPCGRRVSIGSLQRWQALRDAHAPDRLAVAGSPVASAIGEQDVCGECVLSGPERFHALRFLAGSARRRSRCSRCGIPFDHGHGDAHR
jgi:hypothetical protein